MLLVPKGARTGVCALALLSLVGCMSQPGARGPAGPVGDLAPAATYASPPRPPVAHPADPELLSLWQIALVEDFHSYTQACRRIIAGGPRSFPFLIERLDQRRPTSSGLPMPLAQALIGRILASRSLESLHELLGHGEPVIRYETARVLAERAAPSSIIHLNKAMDDPDMHVRRAVDLALRAAGQ